MEVKILKRVNLSYVLSLFKRNYFVMFYIILLFICFNSTSFATLKPSSDLYVNDSANIINFSTENYIIQTNKLLQEQTGAQIIIVTVSSLGEVSIEDYSNSLFNNLKIGNEAKAKTTLFVLSLEEKIFQVISGSDAKNILTDDKIKTIRDVYMLPAINRNDLDNAIQNFYNGVLKEVSLYYGVDAGGQFAYIEVLDSDKKINKMEAYFLPFVTVCSILGGIFGKLTYNKKINKKQIIGLFLLYFLLYTTIILIISIHIIFTIMFLLFGFLFFISTYLYNYKRPPSNKNNSGGLFGGTKDRWNIIW